MYTSSLYSVSLLRNVCLVCVAHMTGIPAESNFVNPYSAHVENKFPSRTDSSQSKFTNVFFLLPFTLFFLEESSRVFFWNALIFMHAPCQSLSEC